MPQVELTDKFCQSAKALNGRQTDYFDTTVKGLCLRVSPAGARTWNLLYTRPADGKRARMKIGRYPEIKLGGDEGARQRAKDARAAVGDGGDPIAEKKALAISQNVADLIENYISRHAMTKRTGPAIARRLRYNIASQIGPVKLSELHRRDITRCIDSIKDRGAHIEANRVFEDVRAMVRWARSRGDLDVNLVEGMRKPSMTVERDRVLSADEIRTVWAALPDADMRDSTRRVIALCLVSGQRVGEVCGMMLEEIDLDKKTWTIPVERSKNKRAHVVPLSELAVDIISEQIAAAKAQARRKKRAMSECVFPAPRGSRLSMAGAAAAKAIKKAEVKNSGSTTILGVKPFTPHDLRRTAATHMEEIGISPFIIGHILNHVSATKSSVTSRIYARYTYDKEKREALDLWADRLLIILKSHTDVVELAKRSVSA